MLFLKRGLMAAGGLALAAMLLNFVAPRAAHALVATAVQVMNTSATPVMTRDVDAVGRSAHYLVCQFDGATCVTGAVPSGYNFVLDSVSFYAYYHVSITPPVVCQISLRPTSDVAPVIYRLSLAPDGSGGYFAATNLAAYANDSSKITTVCTPHDPQSLIGYFVGHLVSTP